MHKAMADYVKEATKVGILATNAPANGTTQVTKAGTMVSIIAAANDSSTVNITRANGKDVISINGVDRPYNIGEVTFIVFDASGTKATSNQVFTNSTDIMTQAISGAGNNAFTAGSNYDYFVGNGNGKNVFTAADGFVIFESGGKSTALRAGSGSGLWYYNANTTYVGDKSNYILIKT